MTIRCSDCNLTECTTCHLEAEDIQEEEQENDQQ